ncbi:D-alanine--D-alanine ligase family protein [Candidatus Viridilinea mediisalina]|uniref:D-alanine--D-alanine ligase n=1 Tax=Candidatus Viridilinea mediisalina TaxID=2024553 RepID=A0A2A6RPV5_9CHLR|nr:D-alanine--D-alanine ligase family protein [Candidatus Viridilinea mediisalina]PDW04890.1 D-alanine--D-alanine ligase A [Candidatus Viridilinea mediisalina]
MNQKLTVAVLFGGQSGEHEVSLLSAQAVMAALNPERYTIFPVGITKDGRWIAGDGAHAALLAAADPARLPGSGGVQAATGEVLENFSFFHPPVPLDVVFPVLHGPMGEDGTVQGLLELVGLPYVGCGVAASAVGLDKALMKAAFAAVGLPLLPWLLVRRSDFEAEPGDICAQIEATLRYPVFVKPANMGSSVGVGKANDQSELLTALSEAARYDRRIVVEQGIAARELEVSVLGNEELATSVVGEAVPSGDWYDYAAKYLDGASQIIIPAQIEAGLADQITTLAKLAFQAIDGAGLSRVDFLLDKDRGELWINEVNTMPGFTPISMYAKMWAASGLEYADLLDRLITLALERHAGRA